MRLFLLDTGDVANPDVEVTGIVFHETSRFSNGGGVLLFSKHDFENATIETLESYLWLKVEVKTNDLADVIWEGWIVKIRIRRNKVWFHGVTGPRVLDKIRCKHSSIIFDGQVTAIGANYIDDGNASFDAGLIGKAVIFSDAEGLDTELVDPNGSSNIDGAPTNTIGVWGNMITPELSYGYTHDGQDATLYVEVHFTLPNYSTSSKIEFSAQIDFLKIKYYTQENERPRLMVYDYNQADWAHDTADIEGDLSYVHEWSEWGVRCHIRTAVIDNISDYVDGSGNFKVRINAGMPLTSSPKPNDEYTKIVIRKASVTNTYSALFDAQENIYTIDTVPSATRLTFVGNPQGDGVGTNDLYRIGDTLDTIVTDIWKACELVDLVIDFDVTTLADAQDYYKQYVGNVLRIFAKDTVREIWHSIGWTIKCKSSYAATGLSLTDTDIKPGWEKIIDGENMANIVVVYGASIEMEAHDFTDKYACPQTIIYSNPNITSQSTAFYLAWNMVSKSKNPKRTFPFRIDMDKAGEDFSAIYTGLNKTLNMAIDTDDVVLTNARIVSIQYYQNKKEHLIARIEVEV